MDDFPAVFYAFLPPDHVQRGEQKIWASLFNGDFASPDDALQFGWRAASASASARCSGDPQTREGLEGIDKKCALHRETEKERRNHLKSGYAQLFSLLPHSNIKCKATISDQLSEATEYIRHLQEEVDELAKKREDMKMKMRMNEGERNGKENGILFKECEAFPVVTVNHVGSRVVVTTNNFREQMVLSKLLLCVEEEGLQLLSASSFFTNDKVFHTLHCKVPIYSHTAETSSASVIVNSLWTAELSVLSDLGNVSLANVFYI
ncbi:hypothetical protein KI387_019481 [Taxus chinensis]|uniref:BHLH domain-containing protein n=1 Tax=Taxus chinensis TaxID=29808 RepID=A0AA38G7D9_TAXCH|nr:hypothetical protein KI387_019481 [Taxus chinensis]